METVLQQILNHVPYAVWYKTTSGNITYANPALGYLMNKPVSDLIGKTDMDLWPRKFAMHFMADDQVVIKTREEIRIVEELPNRRWVETIKIPIVRDDVVVGVVGIARDVTDEREFSTNIQASIDRLERLLGDAT